MNQEYGQKNVKTSADFKEDPAIYTKIYNLLLTLFPVNTDLSDEEASCIYFSISTNASMIKNLFNTPEKKSWLAQNTNKLKDLIQEILFDKKHFITENYEILERRLNECMNS